jgi:hypothetical protein
MLTVGGLLLGTVLTVPGAMGGAAPADPFDPSAPRVTTAHSDAALGLRDPFAPDPVALAAATGRRVPRPSDVHADLRNPFAATELRHHAVRRPSTVAGSGADLRSPFERAHVRAPSHGSPTPSLHGELRDPFGR